MFEGPACLDFILSCSISSLCISLLYDSEIDHRNPEPKPSCPPAPRPPSVGEHLRVHGGVNGSCTGTTTGLEVESCPPGSAPGPSRAPWVPTGLCSPHREDGPPMTCCHHPAGQAVRGELVSKFGRRKNNSEERAEFL